MIPVVFSSDHNFIMPTGVAILSMLECSKDCKCDIYVLQADNVTESDRNILSDIVGNYDAKINFITVGNQFQDSYEVRGITTASYFRLLIPWLIPQYDKIVYCDGDIVFKNTVSSLYSISVEDNYLAGVKPYLYDGQSFKEYAPKLGVDVNDYINAGILLMNIAKMRNDNLKSIFVEEAKIAYNYQDQDILNKVCRGKIVSLPLRYNVTPTCNKLLPSDQITIIHYPGNKPWNFFTEFWYEWWHVYVKSPFYDDNLNFKVFENTWNRKYTIKELLLIYLSQHARGIYNILMKIRNNS